MPKDEKHELSKYDDMSDDFAQNKLLVHIGIAVSLACIGALYYLRRK